MRRQVAVADRRDGHDAPPEADGDRPDVADAAAAPLRVVHQRGEDDGGDDEEDGEHQQLLHARPDRVQQDAERRVVLHQVEDPEDAHDPQDEDRLDDGDVRPHADEAVCPGERDLQVERQQG